MRLKTDNRFHKLEVAMRQVQADIKDIKKMAGKETQDRIEALEEFATYADNLLTQLNHALPDTPEPKIKQLEQSAFDHEFVTDAFNYAAINSDGQSIFFSDKPKTNKGLGIWFTTSGSTMLMLKAYDKTNWQNSLIERDAAKELLEVDLSSELTGSDLCRAMLARGDRWILCGNTTDGFASPCVIDGYRCHEDDLGFVLTNGKSIEPKYIHPVNNQGEPLTASEVGL